MRRFNPKKGIGGGGNSMGLPSTQSVAKRFSLNKSTGIPVVIKNPIVRGDDIYTLAKHSGDHHDEKYWHSDVSRSYSSGFQNIRQMLTDNVIGFYRNEVKSRQFV
jgi:hypothetical protein